MDERRDAKGKVLRSQFGTAAREIFLQLQTIPILSEGRARKHQARA
jgi:hypothetical protein